MYAQGNAVEPHRHQGSKEPDEEGTLAAEADVGGSRLPVDAGRVVTLEHCLTWGGEQRKRCRTTLAVSGT